MKRNLLKALGISFLIFVLLSWVVPTGTYTAGKLTTGEVNPVGLGGLVNTPISTMVTFAMYGVVFLFIGGFYGVVEKAGILEKITNRLSKKFEGKENVFLVLTTVLFVVLSSLSGLVVPLFVLVPLFAAALFKLGYDKTTVLASTVGGLIVGMMASTLGFNITGYTKNLLNLDMLDQMGPRVISLVLLTLVLCWTVVSSSKKSKKDVRREAKKEEIKKAEKKEEVKEVKKASPKKTNNKKTTKKTGKKPTKKGNTRALAKTLPVKKVSKKSERGLALFVVILILMLAVAFLGMYNWFYSFGISVFNDWYEAVMGVKIKDFAIFKALFGGISQFGYWSNLEFSGLLVATSMLIALVYRLKFNDYVEAFIGGMKKWMPTAIYAALSSVILSVLYQSLQSGAGTLVDTINGNLFKMADGFNPIITAFGTLLGSFFFNDLYYLLADLSTYVSGFDTTELSVAGMLIQSVYGVAMMIFPTSTLLIAGLSIFDVSYKKWIKYIWRFALISFLLILVIFGIVTLL